MTGAIELIGRRATRGTRRVALTIMTGAGLFFPILARGLAEEGQEARTGSHESGVLRLLPGLTTKPPRTPRTHQGIESWWRPGDLGGLVVRPGSSFHFVDGAIVAVE